MAVRKKPKRIYFSVTEDIYQIFKDWCKYNKSTMQEQLECMFETWLLTEVTDKDMDFNRGRDI